MVVAHNALAAKLGSFLAKVGSKDLGNRLCVCACVDYNLAFLFVGLAVFLLFVLEEETLEPFGVKFLVGKNLGSL